MKKIFLAMSLLVHVSYAVDLLNCIYTGEENVIHPLHNHQLKKCNLKNGWNCDNPYNCPNGHREENTTDNTNRYRCSSCNFDLCEECFTLKNIQQYVVSIEDGKEHIMVLCPIDNGWNCNNPKCKYHKFNKTGGIERYRCKDECDFDLCGECLRQKLEQEGKAIPISQIEHVPCKMCVTDGTAYIFVHENDVGHVIENICEDCAKMMDKCPCCFLPVKCKAKYFLTS